MNFRPSSSEPPSRVWVSPLASLLQSLGMETSSWFLHCLLDGFSSWSCMSFPNEDSFVGRQEIIWSLSGHSASFQLTVLNNGSFSTGPPTPDVNTTPATQFGCSKGTHTTNTLFDFQPGHLSQRCPRTICSRRTQIHPINHVTLHICFPNPEEILITLQVQRVPEWTNLSFC